MGGEAPDQPGAGLPEAHLRCCASVLQRHAMDPHRDMNEGERFKSLLAKQYRRVVRERALSLPALDEKRRGWKGRAYPLQWWDENPDSPAIEEVQTWCADSWSTQPVDDQEQATCLAVLQHLSRHPAPVCAPLDFWIREAYLAKRKRPPNPPIRFDDFLMSRDTSRGVQYASPFTLAFTARVLRAQKAAAKRQKATRVRVRRERRRSWFSRLFRR